MSKSISDMQNLEHLLKLIQSRISSGEMDPSDNFSIVIGDEVFTAKALVVGEDGEAEELVGILDKGQLVFTRFYD